MKGLAMTLALSIAAAAACGRGSERTPEQQEPPRVIDLSADRGDGGGYTAGADPAKDIVASIMGLQKAPFWTSRISSPTMPSTETTMLFVAPDRYHMKSKDSEVIAVGRTSWVKEREGWIRTDIDFGGAISAARPKLGAGSASLLKDVRQVGREEVSGRMATVYSYVDNDAANMIWIEEGTGRLLKTVARIELDGKLHERVTVFDYATPVSIEPPPGK